jgi:hypothetical protein
MKSSFLNLGVISIGFLFCISVSCNKRTLYKKAQLPYTDAIHKEGIQNIPGKLQCEYYNLGGEGIAYHDVDTTNSGSGNLNKGQDYLSTFRINEAVDISFTKYHDSIDNSKYNIVKPAENQLYLGWTVAGEWTKYTVNVKQSGIYQIGLMYTSNQNGQIKIDSDYITSGILDVNSTFHVNERIQWRQWHHWNYNKNLGKIKLKKGVQILTLNIVAIGQMNFDYLEFVLLKK